MRARRWLGVSLLLIFVGLAGQALRAKAADPIASVHLTAGWATFGQVVPQGLAADGLQVGSLDTQTDVKNRWPDGSIRFAIVTANIPAEGDYAVTASAATTGGFVAISRNVSANLVLASVPYSAEGGLPGGDVWLDGPLVREARLTVAPRGPGGVAHPFLRVNFDTRYYNNGDARVDVSVENVLDKIGAKTVTYDVAINVDGVTEFSRPAVTHFYLTRWRFEKSFGTFSTVSPDMTPFNLAGALPPYLSQIGNVVIDPAFYAMTGAAYDILGPGQLNPDMPAHGGNPDLAPYPDWAARYLVNKDPNQRDFVLKHGDLSGSWPVHVREAESATCGPDHDEPCGIGAGRYVSLDQRPSVWFDERAQTDESILADGSAIDFIKGLPLPYKEYTALCPPEHNFPDDGDYWGCTAVDADHTRLIPDNAHQPSLAYIPYMLTGDRYYAEEMSFWANYGMLRTLPSDNLRGSAGILANNEVRGYGWALRNLADAAAYSPEAAVGAYFAGKVHNNLDWLEDQANIAASDPNNPLQLLWIGNRPEPGYVSLWEQTYLAYAIDRANRQGFAGGQSHRNAINNLQLKLFTSAAEGYPRNIVTTEPVEIDYVVYDPPITLEWAAPYLVGAGTTSDPDSWSDFHYYTNMSEVYSGGADGSVIQHPTNGGFGEPYFGLNRQRDYAGYYGPEARLNLMMLIDRGVGAAQEPYDYLFPFIAVNDAHCSSAYGGFDSADRPDLSCRAGWALDFYPAYTPPSDGDSDGDGDGVFDAADNCPAVANTDQANHDADDLGDACDADDDNDGFADAVEVAAGSDPLDPASRPEVCDGIDNDLNDGTDEGFADNDGDGQADCVDPDDDNDGRPDDDDPLPFVANRAPAITSPGAQTSTIGQAITPLPIDAGDPDGDQLNWSASGLPAGLSLSQFGVISGTPSGDALPDNTVTITLSDGLLQTSISFSWTIVTPPTNRAPVITAPAPPPATVGVAIAPVLLVASDPDSDPLTYSATGLPPGLRLAGGSNVISGTPTKAGAYTVIVSVSDGTLSASASFSWLVQPPPPPAITLANPGPQTSTEGDEVELRLQWTISPAAGKKGHDFRPRFRAENLPKGLHLRHDGVISGRVGRRAEGVYQVTLRMLVRGQEVSQTFTWTILPLNHPPKLKHLEDRNSKPGQSISLNLVASDADEDSLTFSATNLPPGLTLDPAGRISGVVGGNAALYHVTITVTDGHATDSDTFHWTVAKKK